MEKDKADVDMASEDGGRDSVPRGSSEGEGDEARHGDTPGPLPQYQYDRNKLNELSKSPAAKMWPGFLDKEYMNEDGCWDPEKWFRGCSPVQGEFGDRKKTSLDLVPLRKRPADPKERLKEERDGIVLSPQRRSFGTGCHVTQASILRQQSCPSDFREGSERDRDRRDQRRIGSGRIQIDRDQPRDRDRDFHRDRFDRDLRDRDRDRDMRDRDRDRGDSRRFDDRFSRDSRDSDRRRDYRGYSGRRGRDYRQEEEEAPEWFTEGPISQTDTIELRGFDRVEEEEDAEVDESPAPKPANKENKKQTGICVTDRNGSLETNESSSPETDSQPVPTSSHAAIHHQNRRSLPTSPPCLTSTSSSTLKTFQDLVMVQAPSQKSDTWEADSLSGFRQVAAKVTVVTTADVPPSMKSSHISMS